MGRKYYKINVENLFDLDYYGLKKYNDRPAHIGNVTYLDYIYKLRYPLLMQKVADLQYINFRCKEQRTISNSEKLLYNVPDYFLVADVEPNGYFEYTELLTEITLLIPSEVYAKIHGNPCDLKIEISEDEAISLFNDDYIEKISGLFNLIYDKNEKETSKQ